MLFLQILTPFFKPNKLSLARGYWNAAHHLFGYATIALSVLVIFRGFHLLVVRAHTRTQNHGQGFRSRSPSQTLFFLHCVRHVGPATGSPAKLMT